MKKFKEFLSLREDPMQAMQAVRNQMQQGQQQQQPNAAQAAVGTAVRVGADMATGGMASTVLDVVSLVSKLFPEKKQADDSVRLDRLMQQFKALNLPPGYVDINEELFYSISNTVILSCMQKTIDELKNMNGKYNPKVTKYLFNRKVHDHFGEVFGNTKG